MMNFIMNRKKYLLTAAAVTICFFPAIRVSADTVRTTVTESSDGTVVKKTVTEAAPAPATVRTTVTETPEGDTVVRKTVTRTVPADTMVRTTVTTEAPAVAGTETIWHIDSATGAHVVAFGALDLNRDGILSTYEVGTALFRLYDTDGNDIIDNIEYQNRVMVTVTPIEKNTVITYDFDGDGIADKTQTTYETFMRDTMLTRFDANRNGLSPQEFTGRSFLEADINNDKAIDLKEWKGSYIASIDRANREKARFN